MLLGVYIVRVKGGDQLGPLLSPTARERLTNLTYEGINFLFCLDIDHDVRLHTYNSTSVHMNPSRWIEQGASTRHVMNDLLLYMGTSAIFNACTTSMLCIGSGIQHICMHSINMFGTHACNNGCLWTHSHSLGYGRQAYIYSWARVDVHHFDQ